MDVGDRVVIRVGCSDGVVESSGRVEAVDRRGPLIVRLDVGHALRVVHTDDARLYRAASEAAAS